jgi:hypothetical protein
MQQKKARRSKARSNALSSDGPFGYLPDLGKPHTVPAARMLSRDDPRSMDRRSPYDEQPIKLRDDCQRPKLGHFGEDAPPAAAASFRLDFSSVSMSENGQTLPGTAVQFGHGFESPELLPSPRRARRAF